jgi:hypothetical protein
VGQPGAPAPDSQDTPCAPNAGPKATRSGEIQHKLHAFQISVGIEAAPDSPEVSAAKPLCREIDMLWTIAVVLLIMWLLGMVTSYTLNGFIHLLLVLAIIAVLIRVIQGRNPV